MEDIKLTRFELEALHDFLKNNITKKNLPIDGCLTRYLFLAYLKIEHLIDKWDEAMQPSD